MNPRLHSRLTARRILVVANLAFWFAFAAMFIAKSYAYRPHVKLFEELGPDYIYFGRALSVFENEQLRPFIRTTRVVQWPSFYIARPFYWYFDNHGIVVDRVYSGISVGGYFLILVVAISFAQWYLIGLLIDLARGRLTPTAVGRVAKPRS